MQDTQKRIRAVQQLIKRGEKAKARRLIKTVIDAEPSAEAWFIAAITMPTEEQAIRCLRNALELDPWHGGANRMLSALEGVETLPQISQDDDDLPSVMDLTSDLDDMPAAPQSGNRARRRNRRRLGCFYGVVVLAVTMSVLGLSLIGVIPGGITILTVLRGGPAPVTRVDDVPIADSPDAITRIEPLRRGDASGENVDAIDHGYVHEYTFEVTAGQEVEGLVQFMSLDASDVESNVAIFDPSGALVSETVCFFRGDSGFLGGEGGANFNCRIDQTGVWTVRLMGVRGESVGTYFLSVQAFG